MDTCVDCGNQTNTYYGRECLCPDCRKKRRQAEIIKQSGALRKPKDLEPWSGRDMSELFWLHLGRYVKEPNPESLRYMELCYCWACHADHGLSNSFRNAMNWAHIDLYTEFLRWQKEDES